MATFRDRADAGRQLAGALEEFRSAAPVVLALPRGGVPVAFEVATALNAPLEVMVARKLGAPGRPELGVGALAEGGATVLDRRSLTALGITDVQVDEVRKREEAELERRVRLYRGERPLPGVADRTVILIDDGLATGVTASAALQSLTARSPARLVFAAPVCAPRSAERLRESGYEVACLSAPPQFRAVGQWYERFDQTSDQEVIDLLEHARRK